MGTSGCGSAGSGPLEPSPEAGFAIAPPALRGGRSDSPRGAGRLRGRARMAAARGGSSHGSPWQSPRNPCLHFDLDVGLGWRDVPDWSRAMSSILKRVSMGVRCGVLGLFSGVLSCLMADSRLLYIAREQKTVDHIVWPGIVFALVVLLPMSRWVGDGWLRTTTALIASSAVYPIAWRIAAVSGIGHSAPVMIASFTCAGFLGSCVLASVCLFGRPRWGRAAVTTVMLGTAVGGLMGAHLRAEATFLSAGDVLGLYTILWQTAVGASLGRGVDAKV